jgi:ABC-type dipeptide/oligopeptide/nickel transport system ATPase component/ABC-type dipeptide/oligopeptide/nickel transport system permease subunit
MRETWRELLQASCRALLRPFRTSRRAALGGGLLLFFALVALVGPLLVGDPTLPVGRPHAPPSWAHPFGTTGQGQDVLAQTVVGARLTLAVGLAVGLLVTAVGALVGVTAGFLGRRVDDALSLTTNVFLVIPGLPLAIVLAAYLPPGAGRTVLVLSAAGWAWNARVFRAETLTLARRDFVSAALVVGEGRARIILRELLPNMASLLAATLVGNVLYAVGAQVGLEFLGLGDGAAVTWGTNLYWAANDAALLTRSWWMFVPTGACIALVGFALTLVGGAIDALTNPSLRRHTPSQASRAAGAPGPSAFVPAPAPAGAGLLCVRDLVVEYAGERGPTRAVDGVSLEVGAGEVFGLAGESGSGKSTLGHALLRLLPPGAGIAAGRVWLEGEEVTALSPKALRAFRWAKVSMVFQSAMSALNPVLTVGAHFEDTLEAHGQAGGPGEARARAVELLELVGLPREVVDAHPHTLSGGMRQRVGIALALVLRPRLVVMDEPTTALDVVVQKELLQRVLALRARLGFAVLFITHDLPLLLALADRVGVLREGRLVEVGTPAQLRAGARHPYTRQLLSAFPTLLAAPGAPAAGGAPGVPAAPAAPALVAVAGGRP